MENGITVSKLMQIFSRQAAMMDALITHFAEQMRRRKEHAESHPTENVHEGRFFRVYFRIMWIHLKE